MASVTAPSLVAWTAYDAATNSANRVPASGSKACPSGALTVQPGDVLVVKPLTWDANVTVSAVSDSLGIGLTNWIADTPSGSFGFAYLYAVTVPSTVASGSSETVTVTFANSSTAAGFAVFVVEQWRGGKIAATPALLSTTATGAPSVTTAPKIAAGSVFSCAASDYNGAAGTPAYRSGGVASTTTAQYGASGSFFGYFWYIPNGAYQAPTVGMSAPSGQSSAIIGIEIQPNAWKADFSAATAAADCVAAGFQNDGSQRENASFVFNDTTVAWPIPVAAAQFGRAGRAEQITIPDNYIRLENQPPNGLNAFTPGDYPWVGFAFALDPSFPIGTDGNFQVIGQLHQGPGSGSPPVAFEVRGNKLLLTGGAGKPGANPQYLYAYSQTLLSGVDVARWYHIVFHVRIGATAAASLLDVWVDGVQLVNGFQVPGGTYYGTDVASDGGPSYLKFGMYHSASMPGSTIYQAGHAIGPSYAAVDPTGTTNRTVTDTPTGAEQGSGRETYYGTAVRTDTPTGAEQGSPTETPNARPQGPVDVPAGSEQGAPGERPAIGIVRPDTPTGAEQGSPRETYVRNSATFDRPVGAEEGAPGERPIEGTVVTETPEGQESGTAVEVELPLPRTLTVGDVGPTELDLSVAAAPQVSPATLRWYGWLGEAFREGDQDDDYPLLRFLEGAGGRLLQNLEDITADANTAPGWSSLFDLTRAPTYALPWMGQTVGVTVDPTIPDAAQRQQIVTESGMARGTVDSIRAVALSWLTGPTPTVEVTERDGRPWVLTVAVYAAQLVGRSYASLSQLYPRYTDLSAAYGSYGQFAVGYSELYQALKQVMPAGLTLNLIVRVGPSYAALSAAYRTYSALAAAYPTYDQMTGSQPVTA